MWIDFPKFYRSEARISTRTGVTNLSRFYWWFLSEFCQPHFSFSFTIFIFYVFLHLMILPIPKLWVITMVNNFVFAFATNIKLAKSPIINFSTLFPISELSTIIDSCIKIHNTPKFFFPPSLGSWLNMA